MNHNAKLSNHDDKKHYLLSSLETNFFEQDDDAVIVDIVDSIRRFKLTELKKLVKEVVGKKGTSFTLNTGSINRYTSMPKQVLYSYTLNELNTYISELSSELDEDKPTKKIGF